MLPNSPSISPTFSSSSSIHINPRFRNVHINPIFLSKPNSNINGDPSEPVVTSVRPQIYINPRFLGNHSIQGPVTQPVNLAPFVFHPQEKFSLLTAQEHHESISIVAEPLADTKIHTRTKIINPSVKPKVVDLPIIENVAPNFIFPKSLIKIGSKKLVRVSTKSYVESAAAITKVRRPLQTKYKIIKEQTAFKIDRRSVRAKLESTVKKINLLLPSKKLWINESLMPTKMIKSNTVNRSLVNASSLPSVSALRKSTSYLNINGILYKSNHRKLEKTTLSSKYSITNIKQPKNQSYCRLIVRGENFLLDANGKNLIRVHGNNKRPINDRESTLINRKRIDIGKITFVKKSDDTYERTDYHKNRYHLNMAKQRSIQMLTNRMMKTNVPCPIFRKLGKCAAFIRGKCAKLHDKKLVDVCPRFLKGTCDKSLCPLSHNTTLSKMPTCKFYLQGMCSKTDCPYLHKKVNDKTEICVDFLRGFCEKAEECSKRHEFLCPEQQIKGICKLTRCPYPHQIYKDPHRVKKRMVKQQNLQKIHKEQNPANMCEDDGKMLTKRYFNDEINGITNGNSATSCSSESTNQNLNTHNVGQIIVVRKPIVGSLPSFIPIG